MMKQKEFCQHFGITATTAWLWRKKGLPHLTINKRVYYDLNKAMSWLEEQHKLREK